MKKYLTLGTLLLTTIWLAGCEDGQRPSNNIDKDRFAFQVKQSEIKANFVKGGAVTEALIQKVVAAECVGGKITAIKFAKPSVDTLTARCTKGQLHKDTVFGSGLVTSENTIKVVRQYSTHNNILKTDSYIINY